MPSSIIECAYCHKSFRVSNYRLKVVKQICCSYLCSARFRTGKQFSNSFKGLDQMTVKEMRRLYEHTMLPLAEIARRIEVYRSTVYRYAQARRWKRFPRPCSLRIRYRKAAAKAVGRDIRKGEHVHHIDGVSTHNAPSNLHLFPSAAEHSASHRSLETCAFILFRKGLVRFSRRSGRYSLVHASAFAISSPTIEMQNPPPVPRTTRR